MTDRERWTTRITFILATLGFSAGIGNLWRFPYLVGKYGGGIFLLFYLLVAVILTIPLFSLEVSLGKASGKDPVGAYKALAPGSKWFLNGYLNIIALILVVGYAIPIVGSILAYVCKTAVGTFTKMPPADITNYYLAFSGNGLEVMLWTILAVGILILILRRGLKKGVEAANNFMMPALFIILVVLIIRAVTLPGVARGLSFYLKPDLSKFSWEGALAAIGQNFFAIGVGMAVAVVYGSYLPRTEKKVVANVGIIVLASTMIAFMAGLIIFPSVFAFSLDPASGVGLTFMTMPNVFNRMPAGTLFGTLFYILFFLAALTSFIGAFEGVVAWLRDQFRIPRNRGVVATGFGVLVIASFSAFSSHFFSIADYIVNNILLILGALLISIFVGWVWSIPRFADVVGMESRKNQALWTVLIKYLVPIVIFVTWLSQLGLLDWLRERVF
jgi:NSS family neurotransmitter:Na+ symporter